MVKRMRKAGIQAFPFHRVIFIYLANRLNYRNHRKIIIVDGSEAFVGGINVSDKYINYPDREQMYWRDTHLYLKGQSAYILQHTFMCDWRSEERRVGKECRSRGERGHERKKRRNSETM